MPHILIVDDDEDIRNALHFILKDAGYTVAQAENGEAALIWLRAQAKPTVVMLDVMMPRLDGLGLLRILTESEPQLARRHRFILMTARERTLPLSLAHLRSQMHIPLLGKPFDLAPMLALVAQTAQQLPPYDPTKIH